MKKVKGLRSTISSYNPGDVRCSVGNTVSDTVISMYGARWALEISTGSLWKVYEINAKQY